MLVSLAYSVNYLPFLLYWQIHISEKRRSNTMLLLKYSNATFMFSMGFMFFIQWLQCFQSPGNLPSSTLFFIKVETRETSDVFPLLQSRKKNPLSLYSDWVLKYSATELLEQEYEILLWDHIEHPAKISINYLLIILIIKVYMTWKIVSAYLKGLSKCRRMAFFFLKYLFLV